MKRQVVALATGTKCFPQNVNNSQEDIVDCHAESLLKRAFKRYLIELLDCWITNGKLLNQFYQQGKFEFTQCSLFIVRFYSFKFL